MLRVSSHLAAEVAVHGTILGTARGFPASAEGGSLGLLQLTALHCRCQQQQTWALMVCCWTVLTAGGVLTEAMAFVFLDLTSVPHGVLVSLICQHRVVLDCMHSATSSCGPYLN
jgi:ABC-type transport system involved in cytochrome c biogenesis permease component